MGLFVNATLRPLYHGNYPIPIVEETVWVPGWLWAGAENIDLVRNRSQKCPACNESNYAILASRYVIGVHIKQ